METLEIFQVTVKKRIFVIPFDFESECSSREIFYVIYFMGDRFSLYAIHNSFHFEVVFAPASVLIQCSPQSLC